MCALDLCGVAFGNKLSTLPVYHNTVSVAQYFIAVCICTMPDNEIAFSETYTDVKSFKTPQTPPWYLTLDSQRRCVVASRQMDKETE